MAKTDSKKPDRIVVKKIYGNQDSTTQPRRVHWNLTV